MPFAIPPATLAYWQRQHVQPVTDEDLRSLEVRLGQPAPAAYVEFMKTYGPVPFDDEIDCRFDHSLEGVGQRVVRSQVVSFVKSPAQALRYYEGLQADRRLDIPAHWLPFAMDYGQGELLIEFGASAGRVFYWDFDAHDWEGGVTNLGFVAEDLYQFMAHLRPFDA
jgi:hypothetical protein